jgi:hypothetical protein
MLPRYFEGTSLWPLSNLGIDGAGPDFGLDLISSRPPPLVIVETNRLCKPPGPNEAMLRKAMRGPLYSAARRIPLLRAECRPSSMLYSWIKMSRDALAPLARAGVPALQERPSVVPLSPDQLPPEFEPMKQRIRATLRDLRGKGSHVVIVQMPTGSRNAVDVATYQFATELAQELGIPEIDLEAECLRRGYNLVFTDGTHMTPASASQSSRLLAELVEHQLSMIGFDL